MKLNIDKKTLKTAFYMAAGATVFAAAAKLGVNPEQFAETLAENGRPYAESLGKINLNVVYGLFAGAGAWTGLLVADHDAEHDELFPPSAIVKEEHSSQNAALEVVPVEAAAESVPSSQEKLEL